MPFKGSAAHRSTPGFLAFLCFLGFFWASWLSWLPWLLWLSWLPWLPFPGFLCSLGFLGFFGFLGFLGFLGSLGFWLCSVADGNTKKLNEQTLDATKKETEKMAQPTNPTSVPVFEIMSPVAQTRYYLPAATSHSSA